MGKIQTIKGLTASRGGLCMIIATMVIVVDLDHHLVVLTL